MYSTRSFPQTSIHEYPHIHLCHDFSSNLGPERPLLEEDEEDFHNVSVRRHTSLTPSPQSQSSNLSSSPAAMFLSAFMSPQQLPPNPDDEGQIVSGYTMGDIIGYGGTSIVRRAWSVSGGVVAAKIIRRADLVNAGNAPQARKRLLHEASIWSTLSHEHILPLFSAVHTSHADYFFTLYCPAGSLFDILKRDGRPALPQDDVGMIFRQVVRGLRYMHDVCQLVHRDMKLENVLVDEMGMCRIADFGMSRNMGPEDSDDEDYLPDMLSPGNPSVHRTFSLSEKRHLGNSQYLGRHRNSTSSNQPTQPLQPGSLPYAAPELLLPQTSEMLHPHPGQDIWALGVMLYTLLTGRLPFADSFEPRLQMKILNGAYVVPENIGRGAERILQGCLERIISNRWNIAMVDDVAWRVGWGAEGDDATHTNSDDVQHKPHSLSSGLELQTTINWVQEERRPRSAAWRRSSSVSSSPSSSLERGRRPKKDRQIISRSPSPFVPSTPEDVAQASPITGVLEHVDEFHLDPSTGERSTLPSLDSGDESDAKPEDEIADWTAHDQDMETVERDDDTEEVDTMPESKTLMTTIPVVSDRQSQQRPGSLPRTSHRWTTSSINNSYVELRPTPAEPFLNLGSALSSSNLPRSRSAEYNR